MSGPISTVKETLLDFNYGLYLALFIRLVMPTVYQTFRVSILGSLPDAGQLSIASQMAWVNVLLEIIEEGLLQPLYFCLGDSIRDTKVTKNKVKTGLIVSAVVYVMFSATTSCLALPLVKMMGQNETLQEATVDYIRVELVSIIAGSLAKFLMLVFIMLEWNRMLYLTLTVQMVSSAGLDYGLASGHGANLGAMGIAYSSLGSSLIVLLISLIITWIKLDFKMDRDVKTGYNFAWLKSWSRVGFFSGLDSLIRNGVYLVVVLRAMNMLDEQGSYWVANTLIWNWLLLPVLPLSELVKQDVASRLGNQLDLKPYWQKLLPYCIYGCLAILIWAVTSPAWNWFIINVLNAEKPELVMDLVSRLVPCYAVFVFGLILNGVFYALGKTELLALKAFIGNCLIVVLFLLFSNGILFETNVFAVATIFGTGLVCGAIITAVMYIFVIARSHPGL
jgi:hypothetical protein